MRFPQEMSVPFCINPTPKSDPRPTLRRAYGWMVGVIDDVTVIDGVSDAVMLRVNVRERVADGVHERVRVNDRVRVNEGVRLRDGVKV